MMPSDHSVTFATDKIAEAREFNEKYLEAKARYDCGWYVLQKLDGMVV